MKVILKDFLVCDDIRIEQGNKFSIMGLYGDRIIISPKNSEQKEFNLPLSFMVRIQKLSEEIKNECDFKIDISFKDKDLIKIDGKFQFAGRSVATLPIKTIGFLFKESGTLSLKLGVFANGSTIIEHTEHLLISIVEVGKIEVALQ
jgi:hypothetical protein